MEETEVAIGEGASGAGGAVGFDEGAGEIGHGFPPDDDDDEHEHE
jgi:hypothetical protein